MKQVQIVYRSKDAEKAEFTEFKDAQAYAESKPGIVEFEQVVQFKEAGE